MAHITLSALGPDISEQLKNQGLVQVGESVEMLDRLNDSIILLHIKGCLTDAECERARKRLIKKLKLKGVVND